MAIQYVCRYCRTPIGRIEDDRVTEMQLGFHWLTPEERKDIISYELDGEIRVQVVCETCQECSEQPRIVAPAGSFSIGK